MTVGFFADIILIISAWAALFIACFGWGSILFKFFKLTLPEKEIIFPNVWLGWCFSILFFGISHLFFPITKITSSIFFIFGILLAIRFRKTLQPSNYSIFELILTALFAFTIASYAIQPPYCYDSGLYHFHNIRWANEYSIIPGLGNLHIRLGFNQLFFLWAAALNFHPWFNDYAYHIANSFLVILTIVQFTLSKDLTSKILLALMAFLPVPLFWIASPSPDVASSMLQLTAFYFFTSLILKQENRKYASSYISLVAVIACVSAIIKLSNAFFALGLAFISFIYCYKNRDKNNEAMVCDWKKVAAFICLTVSIWVIRGYISTGYPLFPSTVGKINFDWAMPKELAAYTMDCIKTFAKLNSYDFDSPLIYNFKWLKNWFYLYKDSFSFIFIAIGIFCFASYITNVLIKRRKKQPATLVFLWLIELGSLIFWFIQAPDPRFAGSLFLIFCVTGLLIEFKNEKTIPEFIPKMLTIIGLICYSGYFVYYAHNKEFYFTNMLKLPKVELNNQVTDSGLEVKIPQIGDQLWDTDELLSTPEFKRGLALRGKSIQDGFKILGSQDYIKELKYNSQANFKRIMGLQ